jgi:Flp pilus assembly protein TadG
MLLTALMLPIIIGMTGLGVDVSMWVMQKQHLQTAADAAATAGSWEIAKGDKANAQAAATKAAEDGVNPTVLSPGAISR